MYLAIVMDLYSRRIVGWHIDKRMTGDLVAQALTQAVRLRQPGKGAGFSYRSWLTVHKPAFS